MRKDSLPCSRRITDSRWHCWLKHQWSKWSAPYPDGCGEMIQRRSCSRCVRQQVRMINANIDQDYQP